MVGCPLFRGLLQLLSPLSLTSHFQASHGQLLGSPIRSDNWRSGVSKRDDGKDERQNLQYQTFSSGVRLAMADVKTWIMVHMEYARHRTLAHP